MATHSNQKVIKGYVTINSDIKYSSCMLNSGGSIFLVILVESRSEKDQNYIKLDYLQIKTMCI